MSSSAEQRRADPQFIAQRERLSCYWPHAVIAKHHANLQSKNESEMMLALMVWKDLIMNAEANILLTTVDGEICFVGNSSEGFDSDESVGHRWHDFVPADQIPLMESKMRECVESKKPVRYELSTFMANMSDQYHFLNVIWPILEDHVVIGFMSFSTDITEQRRSEARMIQVSQMAAMGEILGSITHEINNPLSIIQMSVDAMIMKNKALPEPSPLVEAFGQKISAATNRAAQTIRTVKNLFRPSGTNGDSFNLNEALVDMKTLFSERYKNAGIKLDVDIPETDVKISGDINSFSHCLVNLMNNSFDAISEAPESWVRVSYEVQNALVIVKVADSGVIPESIKSKILKTSFTTKPRGKGTGLGLGLCQRIINDMGGKIYLNPASVNTEFIIELKA